MQDEREVAEFNESMLQINRLHNFWLQIAVMRRAGAYTKYQWLLDSVELELSFDAKKLDKEEDKTYVEDLEKINLELEQTKSSIKTIVPFFKLLRKKEVILREIQQVAGKGAKYKGADEDRIE